MRKLFKDLSLKEKKTKLLSYRLRRCLSLHVCCLCNKNITYHENYRDGGYDKRAHVTCITNTKEHKV